MKLPLEGCKIALLMSGGIASYKAADLARRLIKKGAQVRVAMTQGAQAFITPLTMQTLTKHYVLTDTFDEHDPENVQHIQLADWCDLALVVPATANIIAKLANGIADEIVSTTLLAIDKDIIIAPAMNTKMYTNPATQRNLARLLEDGRTIIEPATGFLAEGYEGKGRLADLDEIVQIVEKVRAHQVYPQLLQGKTVKVSAGGTVEKIDPVRLLTNKSSGQMGHALARAAYWLGGEVTLVSSRPDLPKLAGVVTQKVESARQLQVAMEADFDQTDYVVMAAAVSDYQVKIASEQKMKKKPGNDSLTLELVENPDILKTLGQKKSHQTLIGFAAETENVTAYALRKLKEKNADYIVANDVSRSDIGFDVADNEVLVIKSDSQHYPLPKQSKLKTALDIWRIVLEEEVLDAES